MMKVVVSDKFYHLREWVNGIAYTNTLPDGDFLHDGRNRIVRITVNGEDIVVKQFHRPNPVNMVAYSFFRRSKAERAYYNAATGMRMGGLCGALNGTMGDCENSGTVTMANATAVTAKEGDVGGLIGYAAVSEFEGCNNYGDVVNKSVAGTYTGGLLGAIGTKTCTMKSSKLDCKIVTADGTTLGAFIGRTVNTGANFTLGEEGAPLKISKATTYNGTAYTADDLKDLTKMIGSTDAGGTVTIGEGESIVLVD